MPWKTLHASLGKAFDKVAKMLGLSYPGGPLIGELAKKGDGMRLKLPGAMIKISGCKFPFSGITTEVKNLAREFVMSKQDVCDMCASFQECISDILLDRVRNAIGIAVSLDIKIDDFVITGGVAANNFLKERLKRHIDLNVLSPPSNICTDNAVMVGWTGIERLQRNYVDSVDFAPRPKWELEKY